MAVLEIPTQQDASIWTQRTTLDGVDYALRFAWNGRDRAWYLSVLTIDEVPLVQGIKMVTNRPLLRRWRYVKDLPAGELVAVDLSGTIDVAGYTDLSNGVALTYFEASEVT